jgi:GTPase SAR1 family protein
VDGEPQAGKTSLIQSFLDYDGTLNQSVVKDKGAHTFKNTNSDFSLKIIKIDGEKVRLQVWDQGKAINPESTF